MSLWIHLTQVEVYVIPKLIQNVFSETHRLINKFCIHGASYYIYLFNLLQFFATMS